MTGRPCLYVTSGWGIHDERWHTALQSLGFEPTAVRFGIDVLDGGQLREHVARLTHGGVPVLAGPLDSVAVHLTGLPARLVGLSWGFDIHQMADLRWLTELDALIVDSSATAALAEAAGVDPDVMTFLPWGVDLSLFTPDGPSTDLTTFGVPTTARTVLSLRAHEPMYRIEDIVQAFARIDQASDELHLIIGNRGSLTDQLRLQTLELDIAERVHFIGRIEESELPSLLRAVDVYVSASEVDGTSVTLLQAMACRTPLLVSDTAGNRCWVTRRSTGRLFTTGDPMDLAHECEEILNGSAHETDHMAARAYDLVHHEADWRANVRRLAAALTGA